METTPFEPSSGDGLVRLARRPRPPADLAAALDRATAAEVRFDEGARALYAVDASNYRQVPIGVVVPRTTDDVLATLEVCRRHGAPIVSRGGGTSLAGQACNAAVVIDFSKHLHRVLEVDASRRLARVEPGTVLDRLRDAAERHGLTFGPDPATHTHCTLGGMIGNNSCGVHSMMAGRTADNVRELDVVTGDGLRLRVGRTDEAELERITRSGGRRGEIYAALRDLRDRYAERIRGAYPRLPRRVSGYNLDELLPENGFHVARALVGSEGTCVTVLEASLELVPSPPARVVLVLGFDDVIDAADHVPAVREHRPIGLEGIDELLVEQMRRKNLLAAHLTALPEGRAWLIVETGGTDVAEAREGAERIARSVPGVRGAALFVTAEERERVWAIRESGLAATARVPAMPEAWPGWEDSAVAPERLGTYLRELRALMKRHGLRSSLYGHFGDGCVHCRIDFDLRRAEGIARYRRFVEEAADLVVRHGGSLSGEHGDGQARGELLERMFGRELVDAFRAFKRIWDPEGRMNPGKVIDARPLDADLRLGADYAPPPSRTWFRFPEDEGSFAHATLRCVGVGACRREEGGVMCPSYRVTREEKHSTRGRAHLLHDLLAGELDDPSHVKEALDLCLSCKGCKNDCPMGVDVATYKAEFLAAWYRKHLRPRAAWSMGWIDRWARLASVAPQLANAAAAAPLVGAALKRAGGIAPARRIPRFAGETFRARFRRRAHAPSGGAPVILWVDTFNEHFSPGILEAAVQVLEAAGRRVLVPGTPFCCGRPLYEFGFLGAARRRLRRILRGLRPWIRAGVPLVVLEPSCLAVFRDELGSLLPHDEDARRLEAQAHSMGELIGDVLPERARSAGVRALLHAHCHQHSVLDFGRDRALLERCGVEVDVPDAGCCGMAGSFGFERDKYPISIAVGEQILLPSVRRALADGRTVVTDGFSCRQQIEHATGVRPRHSVEVLAAALAASRDQTSSMRRT